MRELVFSIEINAPPQVVWNALTDLPRFREWNPFIRRASGSTETGGTVRVRVRPSLAVPLFFHASVLESDEPHELRWRGHVLTSWIASGEHTFMLEPKEAGGVHFVQREVLTGLLPRIAPRLFERETRRGFEAMNRALKARAEKAWSAQVRGAPGTGVALP